jgi:3-methyladenine DNA glycosylase AlkD
MDINKLVSDTINSLKKFEDLDRKSLAPGYYPTSLTVVGVKTGYIRIITGELHQTLKNIDDQNYLKFCQLLVDTEYFECRQVAYQLLDKRRKLVAVLTRKDVLRLSHNNDNWVSVDTFSVMVSGVAWREGGIDDELVLEWLRSDNRWLRRTAIVSTVALNQKSRGGKGDSRRTLSICKLVVGDRDDMVQKALSWALRELSKRDKPAVERFIDEYEAKLPGRIKREVIHKLRTGRKN